MKMPIPLLLFLLLSCNHPQNPLDSQEETSFSNSQAQQNADLEPLSHHSDTTFIVNNHAYRLLIEDINDSEIALNFYRENKLILMDTLTSEGMVGFELLDFNQDKYLDIMINYMGNISTHELYLFQPKLAIYKFVDGFRNFPDAIQLASNKKYYYSYHRAGCADMNWVSDLFRIDQFKTVHVGHIYAQGCDFDVQNKPQEIRIYKVPNNDENQKKLVEIRPYALYSSDFDENWAFIEKYWNSNYGRFE